MFTLSPCQSQPADHILCRNPHGNTPRESAIVTAPAIILANSPYNSPDLYLVSKPNLPVPRDDPPRIDKGSHQASPPQPQQSKLHRSHTLDRNDITMSTLAVRNAPDLQLQIGVTHEDGSVLELGQAPPKSPGAKLGSFFGWKAREVDSPATTFSSPSVSPSLPQTGAGYFAAPSPGFLRHAKTMPSVLDIPKANASVFGNHYRTGSSAVLPTPPASSAQVADLEQELREISTELANSIRREMELEDEVERLQLLSQDQNQDGRRTSDYFSDSGASSVRYGDSDAKIGELEKSRRKVEQEKAQLKLDMTEKMAEVLRQRNRAEDRMHILEEHVQTHSRSMSQSSGTDSDRVRHLEMILEETKRKVDEERRSRDNMEELIGGMRHELKQFRSERDNLRDEVVPELKAKVASLEMFVSDGKYFDRADRNVDSIAEDDIGPMQNQKGLARTRSVLNKRPPTTRSRASSITGAGGSARSPGLSRSGSVKDLTYESREQLAERVRDMEAQREALHKALKNLLQRQKWEEKQFKRRVRQLETERDKVMTLTPRRTAFHREVKNMREEIMLLRQRADDALDQKWHCEKGLSGLKMDLDRSHQETGSLRQLLYDVTLPINRNDPPQRRPPQRQDSLDKAYNELQTTHALSLAHVNDLASPSSYGPNNESAQILALLNKSISDAQAERNAAQQQAEKYRYQARQLQRSELDHIGKEQNLATELYASATRMDDLAAQVKVQLDANSDLRQRLAGAIDRGEREQSSSAGRIAELQGRLRSLEEQLVVAQQASENAISGHEEEVRLMEETQKQSTQLQRQRARTSRMNGFTPAASPLTQVFGLKSPRLDKTSSGFGVSMVEQTQTPQLEERVKELEKALVEAEDEMGKVVGRMNKAQIEVAELQSER